MVRKQVENLRGLVLTPEELDIVIPIVRTSIEMNRHSETKEENEKICEKFSKNNGVNAPILII